MSVRFKLKWEAGARPPAHPKPMIGEQCFADIDALSRFYDGLADDAKILSVARVETTERDVTDDVLSAIGVTA